VDVSGARAERDETCTTVRRRADGTRVPARRAPRRRARAGRAHTHETLFHALFWRLNDTLDSPDTETRALYARRIMTARESSGVSRMSRDSALGDTTDRRERRTPARSSPRGGCAPPISPCSRMRPGGTGGDAGCNAAQTRRDTHITGSREAETQICAGAYAVMYCII